MKEWNRESRELKLRYREQISTVNAEYNRRQVQLTYSIEQARNERSLYIAKIKMWVQRECWEDLAGSDRVLTKITERIRDYGLRKVELDHERKLALLAIEREHAAEVDALEAKYNREEVAV